MDIRAYLHSKGLGVVCYKSVCISDALCSRYVMSMGTLRVRNSPREPLILLSVFIWYARDERNKPAYLSR